MGRIFIEHVESSSKAYQCRYCQTDLTTAERLVSKSFHSRSGKAYLFDKVFNVALGKSEERMMTTGLHTVSDIYCIKCWSSCGWKYLHAEERSQKYKEGKFILERAKLVDAVRKGCLSQQSSSSEEDGQEWNESENEDDPCT